MEHATHFFMLDMCPNGIYHTCFPCWMCTNGTHLCQKPLPFQTCISHWLHWRHPAWTYPLLKVLKPKKCYSHQWLWRHLNWMTRDKFVPVLSNASSGKEKNRVQSRCCGILEWFFLGPFCQTKLFKLFWINLCLSSWFSNNDKRKCPRWKR